MTYTQKDLVVQLVIQVRVILVLMVPHLGFIQEVSATQVLKVRQVLELASLVVSEVLRLVTQAVHKLKAVNPVVHLVVQKNPWIQVHLH